MKLIVNKDDLSKGLIICQRAVSSKPNLPILSNILIKTLKNKLFLSATNLEIGILLSINANIKIQGETTTSAKFLTEYVTSINDNEIGLEFDGNCVLLKTSNSEAKFTTSNPAEFPVIPNAKNEEMINFKTEDFVGACQQAVFAAGSDDGRLELTGVLFDLSQKGLSLVATDGYRLSYCNLTNPSKKKEIKIIIPARTLIEVLRIVADIKPKEVKVAISENQNQIVFEFDDIRLVSRLIDREFPDWKKIVPEDYKTSVIFGKEAFGQALKLTSVFAKDAGNIVKLKIADSKAILESTTKEYGENQSMIDVEIDGPGGEIAFNYHYLSEMLQVLTSDKFKFEMVESLNPVKFSPIGDGEADFYHIIMPVRIQS